MHDAHNDEVDGFLATARDNDIVTVMELTHWQAVPCPPPQNQATLEAWRDMVFRAYRPCWV